MFMDKAQVLQFLPHRDPFLFIDNVEQVIAPEAAVGPAPYKLNDLVGGKVLCHFTVRPDLKILEGHFPGYPILPGVVQVEMMAQASAFLVLKTFPPNAAIPKLDVALLGVERAKFRRPVLPNMVLDVMATLTKVRGPMQTYDGTIHCNGELMSECSFLASLKLL